MQAFYLAPSYSSLPILPVTIGSNTCANAVYTTRQGSANFSSRVFFSSARWSGISNNPAVVLDVLELNALRRVLHEKLHRTKQKVRQV